MNNLWLDTKYANLLAMQLELWKKLKTDPYLAQFRCPVCGDSKKNPRKTRAYFFVTKGNLAFKCHNCAGFHGFGNFLKIQSPHLHDQYRAELYFESDRNKPPRPPAYKKKSKASHPFFLQPNIVSKHYPSIASLSANHNARKYCTERHIPFKQLNRLYWVDDIDTIAKPMGIYIPKRIKNRIGIPFYNIEGKLSGMTCRTLDPDQMRYMNVNFDDEPCMFGVNEVNDREDIYVVEGAIDSLFLKNTIAAGDSNLKRSEKFFPKDKLVLAFDNEPRNREILRLMSAAWYNDFRMVIWPEHLKEKDVNEMILAGHDVQTIMKENVKSSAMLRLAIAQWRKISE